MLEEYHYDHLIRWPRGERAAVFLTFDFQGGEDVKPDKNGILNYEMWSQGEYGPHHAIYRLLRTLKEESIKATFLTCGAIAERYPEAAAVTYAVLADGPGWDWDTMISLYPGVDAYTGQLRALEAGMRIGCARMEHGPFGVDTPEDLERARRLLAPAGRA